ncbi:MAG: TetR family transcriptional regulator [Acidimicrobiia bacterium]|nr:TetR family transcriptional regulator [Acidimicrobiia bacterium]
MTARTPRPTTDPATPTTRTRLVDAAIAVARRDPSHLTLDAVAEEAGVSKGGLLYHFPDKDALMEAIVDSVISRFDAAMAVASAADPAPGGWARAYVRVCADPEASLPDLAPTMLAVVANRPALLGRMAAAFGSYQERAVADTDDAVAATLLRLAADGLWLADAFGLAPPEGRARDDLLALLDRLGGAPSPEAVGEAATAGGQP